MPSRGTEAGHSPLAAHGAHAGPGLLALAAERDPFGVAMLVVVVAWMAAPSVFPSAMRRHVVRQRRWLRRVRAALGVRLPVPPVTIHELDPALTSSPTASSCTLSTTREMDIEDAVAAAAAMAASAVATIAAPTTTAPTTTASPPDPLRSASAARRPRQPAALAATPTKPSPRPPPVQGMPMLSLDEEDAQDLSPANLARTIRGGDSPPVPERPASGLSDASLPSKPSPPPRRPLTPTARKLEAGDEDDEDDADNPSDEDDSDRVYDFDAAWSSGSGLLLTSQVYAVLVACISALAFVEGRLVQAAGAASAALLLVAAALAPATYPAKVRAVALAYRFSVLFQVLVMVWTPRAFSPLGIRRSLLVRAIGCFMSLESLLDSALALFITATAMAVHFRRPEPFFDAASMLVGVSLMTVVPVRGLVHHVLLRFIGQMSQRQAVALLLTGTVPLFFMMTGFTDTRAEQFVQPHWRYPSALAWPLVGSMVALSRTVRDVDAPVRRDLLGATKSLSNSSSALYLALALTLPTVFIHTSLGEVSSTVTAALPASWQAAAGASGLAAEWLAPLSACALLLAALLSCRWVPRLSRVAMNAAHLLLLVAFADWCEPDLGPSKVPHHGAGPATEAAALAAASAFRRRYVALGLCVARGALAFDSAGGLRLYVAELGVMTGFTFACAACEVRDASMIAMLAICSSISALYTAFSRRSVMQLLELTADASNYVDHALKQKLYGCGNAIDSVIDDVALECPEELTDSLRAARRVCRYGHDVTLFAALDTKFARTGTFGGEVLELPVCEAMGRWKALWGAQVCWHSDPELDSARATLNWELVRLILVKIVGINARRCILYWLEPHAVVFEITRLDNRPWVGSPAVSSDAPVCKWLGVTVRVVAKKAVVVRARTVGSPVSGMDSVASDPDTLGEGEAGRKHPHYGGGGVRKPNMERHVSERTLTSLSRATSSEAAEDACPCAKHGCAHGDEDGAGGSSRSSSAAGSRAAPVSAAEDDDEDVARVDIATSADTSASSLQRRLSHLDANAAANAATSAAANAAASAASALKQPSRGGESNGRGGARPSPGGENAAEDSPAPVSLAEVLTSAASSSSWPRQRTRSRSHSGSVTHGSPRTPSATLHSLGADARASELSSVADSVPSAASASRGSGLDAPNWMFSPGRSALPPLGSGSASSHVRTLATPSSGPKSLLRPQLTFAVLDDVSVVRASMLRFLVTKVQADRARSFAMGATSTEVVQFVERVLETKPDVTICDQHLEFGDPFDYTVDAFAQSLPGAQQARAMTGGQEARPGEILGTDVARMLRKRGYAGCVILHSANVQLSDSYDAAFDGFLEKRPLAKDFVERVVLAALAKAAARQAARAAAGSPRAARLESFSSSQTSGAR